MLCSIGCGSRVAILSVYVQNQIINQQTKQKRTHTIKANMIPLGLSVLLCDSPSYYSLTPDVESINSSQCYVCLN